MSTHGKANKIKRVKSFLKNSNNSRDSNGNFLADYLQRKSQENLFENSVNISSIPEEAIETQLDNSFTSLRKQLNDIKQQNMVILSQFANLDQHIDNMRYLQESQYYYQYTNLSEDFKQSGHPKTPSIINSSCSSLLSSNSSSESFAELFDENINSPLTQPTLEVAEERNEKSHSELFGQYSMPTKYNTIARVSHKHQRSNSSDEDQPYSRPSSVASGSINDVNKRRNLLSFRRSSSIRCGYSSEVISKISHNRTDKHVTCL